ncbi:MAG: FtsQ-type POTRA domain-containing protein [Chloroflexota bacterium]|nr:FtsQ-type POTRA domain-containing protein [Chloroflexota bacterium]
MRRFFWVTVGKLFFREPRTVRAKLTGLRLVLRGVLLLLLAVAAYGVYAAPRSGALTIQHVLVEGTDQLTTSEVARLSRVSGVSLWNARPAPIAERLERGPYIARAEVHVDLSRTVHIAVTERVPRAVWRTAGEAYLVDETGYVIEEATSTSRLPTIEIADAPELRVGETIGAAHLAFLLTLYAELPDEVRPVVEKLTYSPATGYSLVSTAGWTAVFGDAERVGVKAQVLQQVLERGGITFVDVSSPTTPYYRTARSQR